MELHRFGLEQLEDRALFSVLLPTGAGAINSTSAIHATPHSSTIKFPLKFAFNVAGTFTHPIGPIGNPDAGSQYHFKGAGKTNLLGKFTLTGSVQTPGFIANARASGKLVITNSRGTITLTVKGPPQSPGSLPPSLSYTISKGTGAFLGSSGKGKITLSASGTTHKFLFRFHPAAAT